MERVPNETTKEQLIADFKAVVADAEALLKGTANQSGEGLAALRAKVDESIKAAKAKMADEQEAVLAGTKQAAKATDVYVRDHPWMAAGVAAAVGLVIGLLSSRH